MFGRNWRRGWAYSMMLGIGTLGLGGCGLPATVIVSSYAANGISLGYTNKTLSDHALSAALERDCAVWRVIRNDRICVAWATDPPAAGPATPASVSETDWHPELLFAGTPSQ